MNNPSDILEKIRACEIVRLHDVSQLTSLVPNAFQQIAEVLDIPVQELRQKIAQGEISGSDL